MTGICKMSYSDKRKKHNREENNQKERYRNENSSCRVIKRCSGCGKKAVFVNTGRFRVNANGNRIDVWLIYQCKKCKHTLNVTLYERRRPDSIPAEEYQAFLDNDEELAETFGRDREIFRRNRLEIADKD